MCQSSSERYDQEVGHTGPHDLVRRTKLQHLFDDRSLTFRAQERENFAEVEEDVGIHRGEVPSFTRVRVTGVQEHDLGFGVRFDNWLHDGWISEREGDIVVAESCMELHYTDERSFIRVT